MTTGAGVIPLIIQDSPDRSSRRETEGLCHRCKPRFSPPKQTWLAKPALRLCRDHEMRLGAVKMRVAGRLEPRSRGGISFCLAAASGKRALAGTYFGTWALPFSFAAAGLPIPLDGDGTWRNSLGTSASRRACPCADMSVSVSDHQKGPPASLPPHPRRSYPSRPLFALSAGEMKA